ncbi:hypothetical protein ACWDD9_31720 [Kitasatospora sp. NPDC001119]
MKTCDYCGEAKPDVEDVLDPFVQDVCNEEWVRPLCDACYRLLCEEI